MAVSNYTSKCMEFSRCFKGMRGITTLQCEDNESGHEFFEGSVYINHIEFLCISKFGEEKYMVHINNPDCEVDDDGCAIFTEEHPQQQWTFGYYKSFKQALNKAKEIVEKRAYPKPIDVW